MSQATAILGLMAETSIHAGAGDMIGVIDLPIQRESHTGWPCVYGSAVKGALRTLAESKDPKPIWIEDVFGPPPVNGTNPSEHGGALAVGDARILLLPVRSLTSHFKWVTCPAVLQRYIDDCKRLNVACTLTLPPSPPDTQVFVNNSDANKPPLFLEEFSFIQEYQDLLTIIADIVKIIGRDNSNDKLSKQLSNQLVIVNDDIFKHLSTRTTPVNPHIAIDSDTKTTRKGALWYEETLPPETLLYVSLFAEKSRRDSTIAATVVLNHVLNDMFPDVSPYLQLGGNETVGMGWCKVKNKGA